MFQFLKGRTRFRWEPSVFIESGEEVKGIGRGWYRIYTYKLWESINREEMIVAADEERLALVLVDIGFYREREIDENALNNLEKILCSFKEAGKEMILRIVYDTEGKGLEREPSCLEMIKTHIRQAGPVLLQFASHIFTFQGLLLGSWGEMHGSKFLSKSCLTSLFETFYEATKGSISISVRSPRYRRMILEEDKLSSLIGLYNDGMMASPTDFGTYREGEGESVWEGAWTREEELKYQEEAGRYAPIGGEVVQNNPLNDLDQAVSTLRQTHVTYLNSIYDPEVLEKWKQVSYTGNGAFYGKTGYDYISAHLGYRFFVKKAAVRKQRNIRWLDIVIENTGFANAYFDMEMRLVLKRQERSTDIITLNYPLRELGGGENDTISVQLPRQEGGKINVWLEIIRNKDLQHIQLANKGAGDGLYLGQCFYG